MTAQRLKVAVVGVGSMGANHARVYANRDDVELVGLCDANAEQAAKIARRFRVPHYASVDELLQVAQPDAVSVAVPTSLHHEVATYLIKRKVHVLLEKPIATTVQEGREIVALAKAEGVKLLVGHIERYNPAIQELARRIRAGELDEIYRIEVDRMGPFPARIFDVGVTLDLAVHDLDIIANLLGESAIRVYCHSQRLLHQNHEDAMIGLVDYPGGVLAVLNINWTTPVKRRQLRVYGRRGMFSVDYLTQNLYLFENPAQREQELGWGPLGIEEGDMTKFHLAKQEPLVREIDFFLSAIRENRDLSETLDSSLTALGLAQLLVESAGTEQPIAVRGPHGVA